MSLIDFMMASAQADKGLPTAPPPQQPQQTPEQPGFFSRLGNGVMDYLGDPSNRARLAAGFNSMRLNPDPGVALMARQQMVLSQQQKQQQAQGNATAKYLKSIGANEQEIQAALGDHRLLPVIAKKYQPQGPAKLPDGFVAKDLQAKAAGLVPGTPEYQRFMGAEASYNGMSGESLDSIAKLRTEMNALPGVKTFQEVSQAIGRVYAAAEKPSPASDLALIFNFMKMQDPASVVRESEFQTAADATAWLQKAEDNGWYVPTKVVQGIERMKTGNMLLDDQRTDFVNTATRLYESAESSYSKEREFYAGQIANFAGGTDPSSYLNDLTFSHRLYQAPDGADPVLWNAMTLQERSDWLGGS